MPEDEDPFVQTNWNFQRDYLKEIPNHTLEITHYEAMVQKVGKLLYPKDIPTMDPLELIVHH